MLVVLGNKEHSEYQNLPNTYHFISKCVQNKTIKQCLWIHI